MNSSKKIFACLVVFILLLYFGWNKLTSPYGDQKVDYHPSSKECFVENYYRYCIYKATQGTNGNIAYHLHGRNLDEHSWNDDTYFTAMIQQYWAQKTVKPPVIVSVSFGPTWLLTPKGKAPESGLLEKFKDEVIPQIESKLGKPHHRSIFGESMGGLNSLIIGLNSESFFHKVAALCPAIYKGSPFAPLSEIKKFLKRTGADPKTIYGVISLAKKSVTNNSEWEKASPLTLIQNYSARKSPKIYLSCGLYDQYGNFEGSQLFVEQAKKKGFQIQWHPIYGGHCSIDIQSLAEFLLD
jgi:S-formylglutathione hydrolase FrmB